MVQVDWVRAVGKNSGAVFAGFGSVMRDGGAVQGRM